MEHYDKKTHIQILIRFFLTVGTVIATLIPIAYVVISLSAYWLGFGFFMHTDYGFEAVSGSFMILGYIFWPLLLACIIYDIIVIIYLHKTRFRFTKEETKQYLFFSAKKLVIPASILLTLIFIAFCIHTYLYETYGGAVLRVNTYEQPPCKDVIILSDQIDFEIDLITKNEEGIYLKDYDFGINEDMSFLDGVYYIQDYEYTPVSMDTFKKEHDYFMLYDKDRISVMAFYKKDDMIYLHNPFGSDDQVFKVLKRINN